MSKIKFIKIIILILGSSLFVPVSCTLGVISGTKTIAWFDSRDVQNGDQVHSLFSVVAIAEENQNKNDFIVLSLQEIEQLEATRKSPSFLMPLSESSKENEQSYYTYKVLEETENGQMIEVIESYKDGDNTIRSKYRATDKNIFPVASEMFYFGYLFQAFPYAMVFALSIFVCGRVLKRRILFPEDQSP